MNDDRGMTLVEMIAVLLLMAIVSAVVLNRFMNITSVSATAAAETVRTHLRYAQAMSMKQNKYLWGIKCTNQEYWLFRTESRDDYSTNSGDENTPIYLPGEDEEKLPASDMDSFTIYYDAYGRPRQDTDNDGITSPTPGTVSISVGSESIQIAAETGFVQ